MDLFRVTATLEEAVKKGLVAIRDIAGRGSWKGMDITLENLAIFKGIDVHIPAGTVFRENSGQLQQMMMASPANIYLPARQNITVPFDDVICTQPRVPAPPPRATSIDDGMREAVSMSEQEFQDFIEEVVQEGLVPGSIADGMRQERDRLIRDPIAMAAIRSGKTEIRYDYSYSVVSPSSISPKEMAEAYLGMATNLYEYGSKDRAVQMFRQAAQVAPLGLDSFYSDVYGFASRFKDEAGADTILWMSSGSNQERAAAQRIIKEVLKSQSNDLASSLSDVLGHLRADKMIALIDGLFPAVRAGIDEYPSHFIKAAGRAAERAAMAIMAGLLDDDHVTDLNPTPKDRSFPIFDVTSGQRVASVKCRLLSESVDEYLSDFRAAMGMGTRRDESENFREAARLLHERAKAKKTGYPAELAVSTEKAEDYLRNNSELWLPHDHVEQVRNALKAKLLSTDMWMRRNTAEAYGLNLRSLTYSNDVEKLLKRICSIGVDSEAIRHAMREAGFE